MAAFVDMPIDFSIANWTIFMVLFFITNELRYCTTGIDMFAFMLVLAEPRRQIAMKHGSNFGQWDGGVLWVSYQDVQNGTSTNPNFVLI